MSDFDHYYEATQRLLRECLEQDHSSENGCILGHDRINAALAGKD